MDAVLAALKEHAGAVGVGLAAALALAALVVLPRAQRREVRAPVLLLLVHVGAQALWPELDAKSLSSKILHFIAVFALLASIARSGFLVFTGARLARRFVKPWPKILRDVVSVLIYFGVAMVALRAVGVEPGSLLATSAVLTAVLGLSLQDTLGNLFAGLALQGQQSFAVGDWLRFADGPEGVGEVIEINWRATHFLTNNQVKVIVPNGVVARSILKNYSSPTPLVRRDLDVFAPYSASPERVREVVLEALRDCPGVLREPETTVVVQAFGDRGVTYAVRCFIDDYGTRELIEGAARQRILYGFRRAGIDIPYPYRHIVAPALEAAVERFSPERSAPEPRSDGLEARLARFTPFTGLEPAALATLARGSKLHLYSPGEAIVRQGEAGTELYALERGDVEVKVSPQDAPAVRVATLAAGAVFGEAALLTGEARTATIVALTECEVLVVPRRAFQDVIGSHPELTERFATLLASRMDQLSQTVNDAEAGRKLDGERRSDLLISRLRSFFGA